MRYYLSQNIHICVVDDQIVVLDLVRDKYLSLDKDASSLLRPYVGLLSSRGGVLNSGEEAPLDEVLSRLSASAILCTAHIPPAATGTHQPFVRPHDAITPRPPFREHVRAHHAARYIASVVSAKSALRMRPLHRVVLSERRKNAARASSRGMFDSARVARLCSVYSRLRVIATGPRQCLFDSLALKLFLAKYGVYPDWIFGVRLNPFAAHCWLQHGNTLVNDSLDSVRQFTPIMAA